jgi:hypothetical protein
LFGGLPGIRHGFTLSHRLEILAVSAVGGQERWGHLPPEW